ncbi:MAG: B12-binding domain-containing protein [Actinomycetota bacterium]|nr:B12-binding domain-containing protein [Actinomycetota bacterium]
MVGKKFKANEMYIPEVLIAARAMHAAMDIIKPLLTESGAPSKGSYDWNRTGRPARYRQEPGGNDAGRRRL